MRLRSKVLLGFGLGLVGSLAVLTKWVESKMRYDPIEAREKLFLTITEAREVENKIEEVFMVRDGEARARMILQALNEVRPDSLRGLTNGHADRLITEWSEVSESSVLNEDLKRHWLYDHAREIFSVRTIQKHYGVDGLNGDCLDEATSVNTTGVPGVL